MNQFNTDRQWHEQRLADAVASARQTHEQGLQVLDDLLASAPIVATPDRSSREDLQQRAAATAAVAADSDERKRQQQVEAAVQAEQARGLEATRKKLADLGRVHGRAIVLSPRTACDVDRYLRIRTAGKLDSNEASAVRDYVSTVTGIRSENLWFFRERSYIDGVAAGVAAGLKEAGL
jgi:hypothetical protein